MTVLQHMIQEAIEEAITGKSEVDKSIEAVLYQYDEVSQCLEALTRDFKEYELKN